MPLLKIRKDVWSEVKEVVKSGKSPKIVLNKSFRLILPKRRPGGVKRKTPEGSSYVNFLFTESGKRMLCRNPGCQAKLKAHPATVTCSEKCENELREWCEACLSVMDGYTNPYDFPMHLRSTAVWAKKSGYTKCVHKGKTAHGRYQYHRVDSEGKLVSCPPPRIIKFRGQKHTLFGWAKVLGFSYDTLKERVQRYGWTIEDALTRPVDKSKSNCRTGPEGVYRVTREMRKQQQEVLERAA